MALIGVVSQLSRYPIKSMLGEDIDQLEIAATGVVGDRVCASIDRSTGKVASAKLPHRWRGMLAFTSRLSTSLDRYGRPLIEVEMPDGTRVQSDRDDIDDLLSAALGRKVMLAYSRPAGLEIQRARPDEVADHGADTEVSHDTLTLGIGAPGGGFVDYAPVHVIASASLDHVAAAIGATAGEAARFRPNIVLESNSTTPFQENDWVGSTLRIGNRIVLHVMSPTPRCAVPTLRHGQTPEHTGITRAIGKMNRVEALGLGTSACLGVYAQVLSGGMACLGDTVTLER
ncbi:MOSC domain-containing protein [Sphingomonas sp. UYP23]